MSVAGGTQMQGGAGAGAIPPPKFENKIFIVQKSLKMQFDSLVLYAQLINLIWFVKRVLWSKFDFELWSEVARLDPDTRGVCVESNVHRRFWFSRYGSIGLWLEECQFYRVDNDSKTISYEFGDSKQGPQLPVGHAISHCAAWRIVTRAALGR